MDTLHRILTDGAVGSTTATLLRRNEFLRVAITPVETQPTEAVR
jgi:hypothetical protein